MVDRRRKGLAHRKACKRTSIDRGSAFLHAQGRLHELAGSRVRRGELLRDYRFRRPWPMDAADPQRVRLWRRARRFSCGNSVHLRRRRDDSVGSSVGQGRRPKLVRGFGTHFGRGLAGRLRPCDFVRGPLDHSAVRHCCRDHVLPIYVLADPFELFDWKRRCRRTRADRLHRQSGRLCRSLPDRFGERSNG
jgi:hypothetical protein